MSLVSLVIPYGSDTARQRSRRLLESRNLDTFSWDGETTIVTWLNYEEDAVTPESERGGTVEEKLMGGVELTELISRTANKRRYPAVSKVACHRE